MQILFLSPYPPFPPRSGGALRMYNILIGLATQHDVHVLTFAQDSDAVVALKPLQSHCHVVPVVGLAQRSLLQRAWSTLTSSLPDMALRNQSSAYQQALQQMLQSQPFDVVIAASIEMAGYALWAIQQNIWEPHQRPKFILDEFNAEYVLQQRAALTDLSQIPSILHIGKTHPSEAKLLVSAPYSLVQWAKLATYERHLLQSFDHIFVVSEEDRQALHQLYPDAPISIVPNGVDTNYFAPQIDDSNGSYTHREPTFVFTGTLDFRPNIDAVRWFAREVLPLVRHYEPAARFVVVGRSPSSAILALHDGVTIDIVGEVADVRPFIAQACAYVVPMRIGGGVRLKLLEALAMHAPVVSTTMGAMGVSGLEQGQHLLLADTPHTFAHALLVLLHYPTYGRLIGQKGHTLVRERYDWQVIVPLVEKAMSGTI